MDHESQGQTRGPRACITCAKAKSRCIPGPTEDVCERCHRLNKPCSAQTPAPPRKRKTPKPTRVADLERRLEDLTARVGSQSKRSHSLDSSLSPTEGGEVPPRKRISARPEITEPHDVLDYMFPAGDQSAPGKQAQADSGRPRPCHNELPQFWTTKPTYFPFSFEYSDEERKKLGLKRQGLDTSLPPSSKAHASSSRRPSPGRPFKGGDPWYYPDGPEAEQLLSNFKSIMAPLFPFVVYPLGMTSAQLRAQRPLLWKATMTASLLKDAPRQQVMGRELLNDIVVSSFLQPKKSFDILQALLILLSWYHIIFKSFQMTNLLFLMRSVCVSLGINESLESTRPQAHSSASLDQMRTYAGVYYLVTMIFTTNKKHDAFMNTSYLDHCCRILEEKMEYPSDQLVIFLVRTQQVSQSISMTLAFRNNGMPLTMIIKSFQREIEQLRASIVAANQTDVALHLQVKIAEILLYEAALNDDLASSLTPSERLEMLWKCLQTTRSMLDLRFRKHLFSNSPLAPRYIALTSSDYTFAMLTCLRLSTVNLPGWDLRLIRKELDFNKYLACQHHILEMFADIRREALVSDAGGSGESRQGSGGSGGRQLPPGFVDPYATLLLQLTQLGTAVKAELDATLPPVMPPSLHATAGGETSTMVDASAAGSIGRSDAAISKEATSAEVTMPAPDFRDDLDELMQTFNQSFWQDMDRADDDGLWGVNLNALMWGDNNSWKQG